MESSQVTWPPQAAIILGSHMPPYQAVFAVRVPFARLVTSRSCQGRSSSQCSESNTSVTRRGSLAGPAGSTALSARAVASTEEIR